MENGNDLNGIIRKSNLDPWPLGWRARIGIISPSIDLGEIYHEYSNIFPTGVIMLDTKVMLREVTATALIKMTDEVIYATELLATAKVDVISYTCTAGAFVKGREYEEKLLKEMARVSGGAKVTTMSISVVKALEFLGVKKIAVAAPYERGIVDAEEGYLEAEGFEVVYSEALGIVDPLLIPIRSPWDNFRFGLNVYQEAKNVEALFLSCGAMRSIEIIDDLEKTIGKPVISSNLCNAWNCLRLTGVTEPIRGFGSLLAARRKSE